MVEWLLDMCEGQVHDWQGVQSLRETNCVSSPSGEVPHVSSWLRLLSMECIKSEHISGLKMWRSVQVSVKETMGQLM